MDSPPLKRRATEELIRRRAELRADLAVWARELEEDTASSPVVGGESSSAVAAMDDAGQAAALDRARTAEKQCRELRTERDEARQLLAGKEQLVRRMHNQIVDLKGNIRVMCRVRAVLPAEATSGADPRHVELPDADAESRRIVLSINSASSSSNAAKPTYEFDHVFGQTSTQAQVFEEMRELIQACRHSHAVLTERDVQSALHGFNVSIIAYGQTGSGKTFTMEGAPDEQSRGLIPRSVQLIFDSLAEQQLLSWTYEFAASFVEIYTDELRDLLAEGPPKKLDIKSAGSRVEVDGLSERKLESADQALELLQLASRNRQVFATKCNDRSSRSHAVFRLTISAINHSLRKKVDSVLSLVDLAGSERLKESAATGQRLTETKSINRSLAALQHVISSQIANKDKEQHVPYRSNKLTLLLQDSLGGGSSKTLMLVTVSPLVKHAEETRRTLDFARQAERNRRREEEARSFGTPQVAAIHGLQRRHLLASLRKEKQEKVQLGKELIEALAEIGAGRPPPRIVVSSPSSSSDRADAERNRRREGEARSFGMPQVAAIHGLQRRHFLVSETQLTDGCQRQCCGVDSSDDDYYHNHTLRHRIAELEASLRKEKQEKVQLGKELIEALAEIGADRPPPRIVVSSPSSSSDRADDERRKRREEN